MNVPQRTVVILLASFNGEQFIDEQLRSIAAQTHKNWILVISDDRSCDRTVELAMRFQREFPSQVLIHEGPQKGFAQNFVSLIEKSVDGDYYAFCDQDDIWLPNKLERAIEKLEALCSSMPALFFSRTALIEEHGKIIGYSKPYGRAPSFQNALVQNIGGGNTMVFNHAAREILTSAKAKRHIVSHDWFAYQIISAVGGVTKYDPEPTVFYRQHASNIVGSNLGLSASWNRLTELLNGRFKNWNRLNIATLTPEIGRMTPSNRNCFLQFSQARKSNLIKKLLLLQRSKVYRQDPFQTVILYAAAALDRI